MNQDRSKDQAASVEPTDSSIPDLVGVAEVAELLEVSKQRVSQLARDARFPQPIAELRAGPVWVRDQVTAYLASWDRRPGRPATPTEEIEQIVDASDSALKSAKRAADAARRMP